MNNQCSPPPGTPAGTVCVLESKYGDLFRAKWVSPEWHVLACGVRFVRNADWMNNEGWRFVCVTGEGDA